MNANLYVVLGLLPNASPEQIKAAYRRMAKRYHPDVRGGNAHIFARISEAYAVLSHPEQRRAYDKERRAGREAGAGAGRRVHEAAAWMPRMFGALFAGRARAS